MVKCVLNHFPLNRWSLDFEILFFCILTRYLYYIYHVYIHGHGYFCYFNLDFGPKKW